MRDCAVNCKYVKYHLGKGKDLSFTAVAAFQAKISSGNAELSLSRDLLRTNESFPIFRMLSFFHTATGFFWSNVVLVWASVWVLYSYIVFALVLEGDLQRTVQRLQSNSVGLFQMGYILSVPMIFEMLLQKGIKSTLTTVLWLLCTGAPIFFLFHAVTKYHFFLQVGRPIPALTAQPPT